LLFAGANVRADTTLIGFDQNDWQRGSRSYIFKGGGKLKSIFNQNSMNHGCISFTSTFSV